MGLRCLLNVLLLGFVCLPVGNALSSSGRPSGPQQLDTNEKPRLQLTMNIMRRMYCVGDSELDELQLDVQLVYTNIGQQNIILYKGSNLTSRTMIGRTLEDMTANRFEVNSALTQLTAGGSKCFAGSVPSNCFAVLPPGASYKVNTVLGAYAVRGDTREIEGAVLSGEHFMQVEVPTWPASNEAAKELRRRWQHVGFLWYDPIVSSPVSFTIDKQHPVFDCP